MTPPKTLGENPMKQDSCRTACFFFPSAWQPRPLCRIVWERFDSQQTKVVQDEFILLTEWRRGVSEVCCPAWLDGGPFLISVALFLIVNKASVTLVPVVFPCAPALSYPLPQNKVFSIKQHLHNWGLVIFFDPSTPCSSPAQPFLTFCFAAWP